MKHLNPFNKLAKVIEELEFYWNKSSVRYGPVASSLELDEFYQKNKLLLPDDLFKYFLRLNGTFNEYDDNLFEFNSLSKFQIISEYFKEWDGIPDYTPLIIKEEIQDYFIFANHEFHLFSYGIRLYKEPTEFNEVRVFCGAESKQIGNSFSDFITLYLSFSDMLFFQS
jgi:hypothetical protein